MNGLTKSQLLEYVRIKRDAYYALWETYRDEGNDIMADKIWSAYEELDILYLCMTDNDYAKFSFKTWTGKEA